MFYSNWCPCTNLTSKKPMPHVVLSMHFMYLCMLPVDFFLKTRPVDFFMGVLMENLTVCFSLSGSDWKIFDWYS